MENRGKPSPEIIDFSEGPGNKDLDLPMKNKCRNK
jgi:hypothetical protein